MKEIELNDDKLKKLLNDKKTLIDEGRAISDRLEFLEKEMQSIDEQMIEEEKKVDISDLNANAEEITARFNVIKEEMEALNKTVAKRLADETPQELKEKYHTMKEEKDKLEEDRNKIGLKAQKYNDKIIPIVRKLLTPHLLDEFDDFESVAVEDGVIKGKIFNHIEDYKVAFRKRKEESK